MDIGTESPAIVIEPVEIPVPDRKPAPAEPEHTPEEVPEREPEKVPA